MAAVTFADSVIALVEAAVPGVRVYDGQVPDDGTEGEPPERYVVVWMTQPLRTSESASGQSTEREATWQTTCVAPDRGMAGWLSDRVTDGLVDAVPEVEGWVCGPIRHTLTFIPDAEEQVLSRKRVSVMDRFELLAEHISLGS